MRAGIDIGGTKTDAVAIAADGALAQRFRVPTGFGPDAVLQTALGAVTRLAELAGIRAGEFESIGIGIPGAVDSASGRVAHAVNLGLEGLELGGQLTARLGRDVRVENDVNAAALGAYHLLEHDPTHSMAYLNLGTGLAAGLVIEGRLWRGSHGIAGEIGHIPVDPNGVVCVCGQRGCLETAASGSAIARQWPTDDPSPASALFAAAAAGDAEATAVRDRLVENVAAAVRLLVLTVDVDSVVIGGGLSSLGEPLLNDVRAVLDRWSGDSPFLASLGLAGRVQLVPDGFPAAAVGAALVGRI
ncbi:putative NBD/HSP70 family sugar kinase [Diaminobutyricimonas aerilata]|uniref:Putative NBD/HSP70 family sugar kinase n=1 Tax=Diaminobutyricimonas aerilata TaxID=1162967 RepID=A0A2M9CMH0_9MICO|nr:ROK family protein [Diaminobutyricimonas aerilata]PJJ73107.1 putative NBD/HSP70 family sugar kinase [Diaminobutyricimonas aerilata]